MPQCGISSPFCRNAEKNLANRQNSLFSRRFEGKKNSNQGWNRRRNGPNRRLQQANHRLQCANRPPRSANHRRRIAGCGMRIGGAAPWLVGAGARIACLEMRIIGAGSPAAQCESAAPRRGLSAPGRESPASRCESSAPARPRCERARAAGESPGLTTRITAPGRERRPDAPLRAGDSPATGAALGIPRPRRSMAWPRRPRPGSAMRGLGGGFGRLSGA